MKEIIAISSASNLEQTLEQIKTCLNGKRTVGVRRMYTDDVQKAIELLHTHAKTLKWVHENKKCIISSLQLQSFYSNTINIETREYCEEKNRFIAVRDHSKQGLIIYSNDIVYFNETGIFILKEGESYTDGKSYFEAWIYPEALRTLLGDDVVMQTSFFVHLIDQENSRKIIESLGP